MKKTLALILTVCLLAAPMAFASAENTTDLSLLKDEQLVALLAEVQSEIVARHIEKTASLPAGTYIGGRDVPAGSYVLATAGTEDEFGIVSLRMSRNRNSDLKSGLILYSRRHFIGNRRISTLFLFLKQFFFGKCRILLGDCALCNC